VQEVAVVLRIRFAITSAKITKTTTPNTEKTTISDVAKPDTESPDPAAAELCDTGTSGGSESGDSSGEAAEPVSLTGRRVAPAEAAIDAPEKSDPSESEETKARDGFLAGGNKEQRTANEGTMEADGRSARGEMKVTVAEKESEISNPAVSKMSDHRQRPPSSERSAPIDVFSSSERSANNAVPEGDDPANERDWPKELRRKAEETGGRNENGEMAEVKIVPENTNWRV
jgi:hypothetical protein